VTHGSQELALPVVRNVVRDLKSLGVKSIYLAGEGEPTMHPEFSTIVNEISNSGLSVAVSTNGALYGERMMESTLRNISWIRFSVDTIDCNTYENIHGVKAGQLRIVKENIARAVMYKIEKELKVDIGVQIVLTDETAKHLQATIEFFRVIGVDNIQIKPCHNHPNSKHQARMEPEKYDDLKAMAKSYETDDFTVVFRYRGMERLSEPRDWKRCHGFDFYVLIDADGNVVPCNVFYHKPEFIYGNVYNETFYDIWNGSRRRDIIDKIEETNFEHCGVYRCRLDVINRYLERVVNPERNDEFI
jgi:radical SAM protein with 4Fe4S-binding SPASM domain